MNFCGRAGESSSLDGGRSSFSFGPLVGQDRMHDRIAPSDSCPEVSADAPLLDHLNPFEETPAFRPGRNRTPAEQDRKRRSAPRADRRSQESPNPYIHTRAGASLTCVGSGENQVRADLPPGWRKVMSVELM